MKRSRAESSEHEIKFGKAQFDLGTCFRILDLFSNARQRQFKDFGEGNKVLGFAETVQLGQLAHCVIYHFRRTAFAYESLLAHIIKDLKDLPLLVPLPDGIYIAVDRRLGRYHISHMVNISLAAGLFSQASALEFRDNGEPVYLRLIEIHIDDHAIDRLVADIVKVFIRDLVLHHFHHGAVLAHAKRKDRHLDIDIADRLYSCVNEILHSRTSRTFRSPVRSL